jgi:hypothetical protein
MKKAMAEADAGRREVLLYLADLGLAVCSAALGVSLLHAVADLVSGMMTTQI